jgi:hypothetical protein
LARQNFSMNASGLRRMRATSCRGMPVATAMVELVMRRSPRLNTRTAARTMPTLAVASR